MKILTSPLILASKSPRRKQLLTDAGFTNFIVKTKEVDESYPVDMPASQVAQFLAEKKATECADFLERYEQILIAADSIVVLGEQIFEKPTDRTDAIRILSALSGRKHQVITGVCLLSKDKKVSFSGISDVYMDTMSLDEIHYYIDKYQPYDKAGAYAIQEWIGHCKISKIEGTYPNIMGLPVALIYKNLQKIKRKDQNFK